MGCFGCSLYWSTVTAGILGILQSILYSSLCVLVCIDHFSSFSYENKVDVKMEWSYRFYEMMNLFRIHSAVKVIIIPTVIFNFSWFFSSLVLLSGNSRSNFKANCVLQWVILTGVMTVYEMLCTFYLLTISVDNINSSGYEGYFYLDLATISRGYGVVFGWSFNIPLSVFVFKRYKEIIRGKHLSEATELAHLQPDQVIEARVLFSRPYSHSLPTPDPLPRWTPSPQCVPPQYNN